MRKVEGYLSQQAQLRWPGALVYREEIGTFTLERPGAEPVSLGESFKDAKRAVQAMRRAAASGSVEERVEALMVAHQLCAVEGNRYIDAGKAGLEEHGEKNAAPYFKAARIISYMRDELLKEAT